MKADLSRKISGFDDFKLVMETIGRIQSTTITIEIQLHEMQETYSVLEDHKIQVGPSLAHAHTPTHIHALL